ncbi:MAG: response regulator [Planctomycetes bacterium]|nr:response regulator [Planctomycetota bacterium]
MAQRAIRILVAEDYSADAELLKECLTGGGYEVHMAATGAEALEVAFCQGADIILLEVALPGGLSGFDVCRKLKEDERTKDIPVLLITALDSDEDKERGIQDGADDFLNKPINIFEVLTRVKSLLRVRHLSTDLQRALDHLRDLRPTPREEGKPGEWRPGDDDADDWGMPGVRATILPRPRPPMEKHASPSEAPSPDSSPESPCDLPNGPPPEST